ncbi:helix-turn-helix domain-containing protein [Streptomyces spinosisporus]|uniref:Helix-turn-helix domain-containing protein n=1 Tax=Streptomyces spinosisporus TaxID=2927582 RepID=A0ABS9XP60_9ACTN|nr:helix-turn-helix transcriptional regulator [Streptomyces spinosisporus]MCI3243849.1 helix-turn-helix domain-containing protein [Streptomyces spinosisporus]
MPREVDPSLNRRKLRLELRSLREATGESRDQVAQALEWSVSKLIRIEGGTVSMSVTDLRALLQHYGVADEELKADLEAAARGSKGPNWWAGFRSIVDRGYDQYLGFESAAASIRTYHPVIVPGLLQTEDYAMAMLSTRLEQPLARRLVELRMERQERAFGSDTPPWTFFVLDEAALRRQVGGGMVQRNQLRHLIEMASRPRVELKVLPFTAPAHYSTLGSFILLGYEGEEDVLYLETYASNQSIRDDHEAVVPYQECFEYLRETAIGGEPAISLIEQIREGTDTS